MENENGAPHSVRTYSILRQIHVKMDIIFGTLAGIWINGPMRTGRQIHFPFLHWAWNIKIYNVCSSYIYCVMNCFIFIHLHETEKLFVFSFSSIGWMLNVESRCSYCCVKIQMETSNIVMIFTISFHIPLLHTFVQHPTLCIVNKCWMVWLVSGFTLCLCIIATWILFDS